MQLSPRVRRLVLTRRKFILRRFWFAAKFFLFDRSLRTRKNFESAKTQSALYYFNDTCSLHCFSRRSRVEALQEISVPCSRLVRFPVEVVESICSIVQHLGDDEGSFPGGSQLVRSLLIYSEHQVACLECTTPDVSRVKAPQVLLING